MAKWLRCGLDAFKMYVQDNGRPDLIHAHNAINAGLIAHHIYHKYKVPYVITEHSSQFPRGTVNPKYLSFLRLVLNNSAARIVVSPFLGKSVDSTIANMRKEWVYIPNILDSMFEEVDISGSDSADNIFTFINIGSLIDIKNQYSLIRAFAHNISDQNCQLKIIGDGYLENELNALINELKLQGKVKLLGRLGREAILDELLSSHVYVHSSNIETFGVSLIEALACGKPVVSTACGGPESIVDESNGKLVPVDDHVKLAQAMAFVKDNINSYDPIVIRKRCIDSYGETSIITKLLAVYNNVTC
jgi:glycosyltransferase involved in cell wall biosynthesis